MQRRKKKGKEKEMTRKMKRNAVTTIAMLLAIIAVIGAFVYLNRKVDKLETTEEVSWRTFKIGTIITTDNDDLKGQFSPSTKKTIATKDFIRADGLTIKMPKDAKFKYSVFFYDENNKLLSSGGIIENQSGDFAASSVPSGAKSARILITPNNSEIEFSSTFSSEYKEYAKALTITVNKAK